MINLTFFSAIAAMTSADDLNPGGGGGAFASALTEAAGVFSAALTAAGGQTKADSSNVAGSSGENENSIFTTFAGTIRRALTPS